MQPKNLTFHNLCTKNKLPTGTKELLGLNLNFCLATKNIKDNIRRTILKMARSIRISSFLQEHNLPECEDYEKQIYICNNNWHPPPASLLIEDKITEFEKLLKEKQRKLISKNRNRYLLNLTPLQKAAMKSLRNNNNIVIKSTDKNLGPAVLDADTYSKQVLQEHLLTRTYLQLSNTEAATRYETLKSTLKNIVASHAKSLSKSEIIYFQRSFKMKHRLPIFYGLPKVHKDPICLRPVVSSVNSLLSVFSNWLDFKMKQLLPSVKSYVKNSFEIIEDLKRITLPDNALVFSADATSMYTNIDTETGIQAVRDFLNCNSEHIPEDFPTNMFLQVLELVMTNNIFSFGDTTWLQLTGTAMGTPAACAYATITYGQHENTKILTEFSSNLLYYKRYIDDIFAIWIPPETGNSIIWKNFKERVNDWGTLKWIIEEPSHKTVFLDLNIELRNSTIHTSTYQKSLNLYLYIPPRSAHPPSCIKGLISGELRRYWLQNRPEDFETILSKFIIRLANRGHHLNDLIPLLQQAALKLSNANSHGARAISTNNLYIHQMFHPNGLQRTDIREAYNATLKPFLNFEKVTVAISRPRNLKDVLTKTALTAPQTLHIQRLIAENQTEQQCHL